MKKSKFRSFLLWLFSAFVFVCCSGNHIDDKRLIHVAEIASDHPEAAIAVLDSIDPATLSKSDRHYYDFLTIKARDKAYIFHTSDSLILDVIDYYSTHDPEGVYPEALYYGGRVYSDLGDYHTALEYFHDAYERLSKGPDNPIIRGAVESQAGRLLSRLRLYDAAATYIKASLKTDSINKDTINLIYDLQLLGSNYLRGNRFDEAEFYLNQALELGSAMPPYHNARTMIYLSSIKLNKGRIDSALCLIRGIPDKVEKGDRREAVVHSARIYLKAGILDTAYMYATELIHAPGNEYKDFGYKYVLSSKLIHLCPEDSVIPYVLEYVSELESNYNEHESQLAINQENLYNYTVHVRERKNAEKALFRSEKIIFAILFTVLILCVITLYYKNRARKRLLELHIAYENITTLKENLKNLSLQDATEYSSRQPIGTSEEDVRKALKKELMTLYEMPGTDYLNPSISKSEPYLKLRELLESGKSLSEENPLWDDLKEAILKASPDFITNLRLLAGSRLTPLDVHTAILIKCHIRPAEMSKLLNRTRSTISTRRETLCSKIMDNDLDTRAIDRIICLL